MNMYENYRVASHVASHTKSHTKSHTHTTSRVASHTPPTIPLKSQFYIINFFFNFNIKNKMIINTNN